MSHPTHKTRSSDSSLYTEVCTLCGANDGRGTKTRLDKPCPRAEELNGSITGRFDSSKPNNSNTPKELREVNPMQAKEATEIVPGKKYLMVIKPGKLTRDAHLRLVNSAPVFEECFKARGIDMTFMVSEFETELYELSCGGEIAPGEPYVVGESSGTCGGLVPKR
jgi:hypothetical protein